MAVARVLGERYQLIRPIGRGGMGEVWSALDTRLDRTVAVKLLRPGELPAGVDHEVLISRFVREARLTAKLEHAGVPAVYDTGTADGDLFLVMQLIEGGDLTEFQAEYEPVPNHWVAAIGAQISSVLGAAHGTNLIHRDLKPRNVMITPGGQVKVLDFGIASLRDADVTRITRTSESIGTPAYMAPEQAMYGAASPASDLYSLGCVLYELVTGHQVFTASTALAMMHRHYSEYPTPVVMLRRDVDPWLAALVAQLLAKLPLQRPADAREVYDRLVALLPAARDDPVREFPMDPTRPFRDRHAKPPPRPAAAPAPVTATLTRPTTAYWPAAQPLLPKRPFATMPWPSKSTEDESARWAPDGAAAQRIGESALLVSGFGWTGLLLAMAAAGDPLVPSVAVAGLGIPLIVVGAVKRKRRLGHPHLWTVAGMRRNENPPRPGGRGDWVLENILLLIAALFLVRLTVDGLSALVGQRVQPVDVVLSMVVIILALLIPGALMRQRRLGNPYLWTVRGPRRNTAAMRETNSAMRIVEVLLMVGAIFYVIRFVVRLIKLVTGIPVSVADLAAQGLATAVLAVPWLLLRQRRLGKPYPWTR